MPYLVTLQKQDSLHEGFMRFPVQFRVIPRDCKTRLASTVLGASNSSHGDAYSWFRAKTTGASGVARYKCDLLQNSECNSRLPSSSQRADITNQRDRVCRSSLSSEYNIPSMPCDDHEMQRVLYFWLRDLSRCCDPIKNIRSELCRTYRNWDRLISHFGFRINNSFQIRSWYFFSAREIYSVKVVSDKGDCKIDETGRDGVL